MPAWIVVCDACVLYPAPLRDLLMWLGTNGLIAARWSERIQEEWVESLLADRPDLKRERLTRTCSEMNRAIPDAMVSGFESLIGTLTLPDPHDRHVLAAAIVAEAEVILTWNRKDFPTDQLPKGIRVRSPDTFLCSVFDGDNAAFLETMRSHRQMLHHPPKTSAEYFATLRRNGLTELVSMVEPFIDSV